MVAHTVVPHPIVLRFFFPSGSTEPFLQGESS